MNTIFFLFLRNLCLMISVHISYFIKKRFFVLAVGHILEIYEFPDTITSDTDAVFDEVRNSGARILKINSSSSQGTSPHSSSQPIVKPTVLAIFKSANEAQKALESVTSPYYKLRVSKKSPTHLSTSDYSGHASSKQNNVVKTG